MQEMRSILFYCGFYFHVLPQFCPKRFPFVMNKKMKSQSPTP